MTENLKERGDIAKSTLDFLGRQLEDAKLALDDQDAKLAAFKKQYQGHIATDPGVELQYKLLTRDNDNAVAFYRDLLAKKSVAALSFNMEIQQLGEQMVYSPPPVFPKLPPISRTDRYLLYGGYVPVSCLESVVFCGLQPGNYFSDLIYFSHSTVKSNSCCNIVAITRQVEEPLTMFHEDIG